jgi:hypothetical protein
MIYHGSITAYLDSDAADYRNNVIAATGSVANFGGLNTAWKNLNRRLNLSSSTAKYQSTLANRTEYLSVLTQSFAATLTLPYVDSSSNCPTMPGNQGAAAQFYRNSVLLPNGHVNIGSWNATRSISYRPETNDYIIYSGSYPGGGAFNGGCLMRDGRVFWGPYGSTRARITDWANMTSSVPGPTWTHAGTAWQFPVLLSNGNILISPYSQTQFTIYHVTEDSRSFVPQVFPAQAFQGTCPMKDGRVYTVPSSVTKSYAYDESTNTFTLLGGTYPGGTNPFASAVLLPDGKIFNIPYTSTKAYVYDPDTDSVWTSSAVFPGSNAYLGGCLTSEGYVFLAPANQQKAGFWNPITQTYFTSSVIWHAGTFGSYGGTLMRDGRVFCAPLNLQVPRIQTTRTVSQIDTLNISPLRNHT